MVAAAAKVVKVAIDGSTWAAAPAKFVKVVINGMLYTRKVNLQGYAGYDHLLHALQDKCCSTSPSVST
jgi:hypothetical protein